MEGELEGLVAEIGRDRPGWEDAPCSVIPVLIGRFVAATSRRAAHYHADSPYLVAHAPELAAKLGSSWFWDAADMALQTTRGLNVDDIPAEASAESSARSQTRALFRPRLFLELTADHPPSLAARMAEFQFHPLVTEPRKYMIDAFGTNPVELTIAIEKQAKMKEMLLAPSSSALYSKIHKDCLNDISMLGLKMRSRLKFELPKTHKAKKGTIEVELSMVELSVCAHTRCAILMCACALYVSFVPRVARATRADIRALRSRD